MGKGRKAKGSTLVESVISMAILLIAVSISIQTSLIIKKSIDIRNSKEKANRVSYAIENEIKYNIEFVDLNNELINGQLSLKYEEDILDKLQTSSLLSLDKVNENGIKIEKIADILSETDNNSEDVVDDNNFKISTFKITIYNSNGGILIEREFIKSYWMEI